MGVVLVAALALVASPTALGGRLVSVGYRTPAALHGLRVVSRVAALHTAEVRVGSQRAERALRALPGIRFVQNAQPRTDTGGPVAPLAGVGTSFPEWQWTATHADLVPAWVRDAAHSITIAIVDTGADVQAPSLAVKSPTTWNVVDSTTTVTDAVGHGTFVASLAAGATLGFGGAAQLMIVQANRGTPVFTDVDEANAIVYAVDHGANIVNLSIGGTQTSLVERAAITYATQHGVLLVAAAGNSAQQGNPTEYPAALLGRGGIVVGAAGNDGKRASFSSSGHYVDVLAPGVNVLGAIASGIPLGYFTPVSTSGVDGAYGVASGTSFASPEVAGAAALVWASNPSLDAAGVAATLEGTASGHGTWTDEAAFGDVDVASAVQRALGGPAPVVSKPAVLPGPQLFKATPTAKKSKRGRP